MRIVRGTQRLVYGEGETVLGQDESIGWNFAIGSAKVKTRDKGIIWGVDL